MSPFLNKTKSCCHASVWVKEACVLESHACTINASASMSSNWQDPKTKANTFSELKQPRPSATQRQRPQTTSLGLQTQCGICLGSLSLFSSHLTSFKQLHNLRPWLLTPEPHRAVARQARLLLRSCPHGGREERSQGAVWALAMQRSSGSSGFSCSSNFYLLSVPHAGRAWCCSGPGSGPS